MTDDQADDPIRRGAELDLEESRQRLTMFMALALLFLGGVVSTSLLPYPEFNTALFSVSISIMMVGLLSYWLRFRNATLAQTVLLIGPILCFTLALRVIPSPAVPFFASLIVIINAPISADRSLVAAALSTVPLYGFLAHHEILVPALVLLWIVAMLSWVSSREFHTALKWTWEGQQRIHALLVELRERRGELNRTLVALTEATRRLERANKELTIARQQADEARAVKEQFVANVSHELRTPLNLIVGFAEMMFLSPQTYEGVVWTPDLTGDIGRMFRASQHLQYLVNDILDLARMDVARLPMFREMTDVRSIVQEAGETVLPLIEQRGLTYSATWPESLPELLVDRTRIRQVMLNLLNNAIRFTDRGGISVQVEQTEDAVRVCVRDTGLGIPQDQMAHIFEEFRQATVGARGRGGAGLGLTISRRFVELHGGRMWAESEIGVGSLFCFSLPLPGTLSLAASLTRIPDRTRSDYSRAAVVLVDPHPSIADMLSRYLGDHPVLPASDIQEAEKLIEDHHPLAVVVNNMPDTPPEHWLGVLGESSRRYNVPILRCSIPSPSWLQQSSGINYCLTKPVTREALISAVETYCPQPGTILVVDDDPGFVSLVSRMLGTTNVATEVMTAYSGTEALRLARERTPDLMLLDLLMPEMDGFEVIKALRADATSRDIAIVAVTATSYAEEALLRRGSYFTLTQAKGLSTGVLTEILSEVVQRLHPDYVEEESTSRIV